MKLCLPAAFLFIAIHSSALGQQNQFRVEKVKPKDGATNVDLEPLIQIHTNAKFDPATVNEKSVLLLNSRNKTVSVKVTADLGGVITLSVNKALKPKQRYRIQVTNRLKAASGRPIRPFLSHFRTGAPPKPPKKDLTAFQFTKHRLDRRDGVCGMAIAPGRKLYACTWDGSLVQYPLSAIGMSIGKPRIVLRRPKRRFLAMVADPESNPERTILWLSHDSLSKKSLGPNDFSGAISKITILHRKMEIENYIIGLPTGDHPATGLVFGPKGNLFVSQGALTMLGNKRGLRETLLSAATLTINLKHLAFTKKLPVNVRTDAPTNYDPKKGPVKLYATGIREAYDLCWHSNGQLYAGVNMNDTREKTPARKSLPAVNVRPAEMLIRILPEKYYGHPNPSRKEWVLLGGNPTREKDPWEVSALPVGTLPEPNFDPKLLIRNLEKDKGPSADGCVEWTKAGPLQGRLLICFYTATRGIHTYAFSKDGSKVIDHQPLLNFKGERLRFGAPLDVVYDSRGWIYVADFSAPERGDSGKNGGVWLARPLE